MLLFSPQVPLNTLPADSLEDKKDPREYLQREQNPWRVFMLQQH